MTRQIRLDRARWRCRRGTKELDVLLERFARRGLDRLDHCELEALERLLERPDQDILEWITSATTSPPSDLCVVIALVRSHATGRH